MIFVIDDNPYETSLTDVGSQFENDASVGSALADSVEDEHLRYEQVISELTEFENAQCKTEGE
jgi:hypothetical protein